MSKESQIDYSGSFLPQSLIEEIEKISNVKKLNSGQRKKLIETVKKEYLKSSFEPGEAIGIISAQSISEPATQMSLQGSERILIKTRGAIEVTRIDDFVDSTIDDFGFKKIGDSEVCDLPPDAETYVLSLNQKEKVDWKRIKSCIRHKSPEKLIKIETKSGRKITATDSHSFVIRNNNRIVPISGKELKIGDRIPAIKYLPENCTEFLNVDEFVYSPAYFLREGYISSTHPKPARFPEKIKLDGLFGWFMGAYLSEGSCSGGQVSIHNIDENFLLNVRKFSELMKISHKERSYMGAFGPSHTFTLNHPIFARFIEKTCDKGSYNKKVPRFAYSAPEEFVSSLLRGYFDGNGNVSVKRKMIRMHSNSEEIIDGIKLLLTRFKIFSHKCRGKKQFYLLIPYKYASLFLSKIGSDIEKKKERLEELSKMAENYWGGKSQDFTDMITGFGDILYRIAKKLKYPTRYVNNFTKRQKIGRTTLYRYIKFFEKLGREKNIDVEKELKILKRMFNSDVVWDEIVKISHVKPKGKYVYDVSVEGLETFTTFEGLITHNTMRTFHFAGSAGIQVTLGLPRLIEIFDARKEPSMPVMTLYLKKKYNTRHSSEKIAKKIRERRFRTFVEMISLDLTNKKIKVRMKKLKKSTIDEILEKMCKKYKNYKITARKHLITIEPKNEVKSLKDLDKIKRKVLDTHISGIQGIKNAVVVREGNDWTIKTLGVNFIDVLSLEEIDVKRCSTNDIYETARFLGIEAARNTLINEIIETIQQQGLDIDERHIMLIADIMTFTGEIKPVGRYGVAGMKSSVLTRAGFEETIKHLVKGSLTHDIDTFDGIFDNVMVNQQIPTGTGMFELIVRGEK